MNLRGIFSASFAAAVVLHCTQFAFGQFGTGLAPVPPATAPYNPSAPVITNQPVITGPPIVAGPGMPAPPPAAYDPFNQPGGAPVLGSPSWGMPLSLPSVVAPPLSAEDAVCGAPGFYAFFEVLWWDAFFPNTPYALQIDPANTFDITPFDADYNDDTGFRIGLGWRFSDGWDFGFAYTDFSTNGGSSVGDDGGNVPPIGERTIPLTILDANPFFLTQQAIGGADDFDNLEADAAREQLSLNYQVYDFEAGRKFCICRTLILRPFAGVRFAQFDSSRSTTYFDFIAANNVDTYNIRKQTDIDGVGPRVGGLVDWNLGGSGFQVFGRSAVSLLVSDVSVRRTDTYFNQSAPLTTSIAYQQKFDELIPVLEVAIGLKYQVGGFFVSGGWELQNWFNVVTDTRLQGFVDPVNGPNFAGISLDRGDIGIGGFFLRGGFNF